MNGVVVVILFKMERKNFFIYHGRKWNAHFAHTVSLVFICLCHKLIEIMGQQIAIKPPNI